MIQSAKYYKDIEGNISGIHIVLSNGEEWDVPHSEGNRENNTKYQEIQKWVEEGNTIEEAD